MAETPCPTCTRPATEPAEGDGLTAFERALLPVSAVGIVIALAYIAVVAFPYHNDGFGPSEPSYGSGASFSASVTLFATLAAATFGALIVITTPVILWLWRRRALRCSSCGGEIA